MSINMRTRLSTWITRSFATIVAGVGFVGVSGLDSFGLIDVGLSTRAAYGEDWKQFRGPGAGGVRADAKLPDTFDGEKQTNVLWQTKLPGRCVGGAIVVGNQVITTSSDGMDQRRILVFSVDATSGAVQWQQEFVARGRPFCHPTSANAAPTPVSDGKYIYAFYSSNDVACLDLAGNLIWYRSLSTDFPKAGNDVGMSSSPVVVDGVLVVQVECQGDSFAAGINTEDGTIKWRFDRPKQANWSSPSVIKLPDGEQVIVMQSSEDLVAITPKDGSTKWRMETRCSTIPSSLAVAGKLIVPSGGLTAYDLSSSGGTPSKLWANNKLSSNACSPVVVDKRVFTVNRTILVCGDIYTGEVNWQLRLPDANSVWSSPVVAGNRLYLFVQDGRCFVVDLDAPEGKIVQTNAMGEEVLGSPALTENAMFVRGVTTLWKIGTK